VTDPPTAGARGSGGRRRLLAGPVLALVLVALAGCTGPTPPPAPSPAAPPAAAPRVTPPASPADSPIPTVAPAGSVVPVGAGAEGIVVDPATRSVVVGVRDPDALVVLDEDTLRERARIALPGHLRHLVLAGPGTVLVPDEDSNRLLTVDLPSARITASLVTGTSPHYVVATPDGTLFVADEAGHDVAVVRAGRVVARLPDAVMPGGMAVAGGRLGLVDVASDTLTIYDTTTLARLSSTPLGAGPTHEVADDRGDLVAADTRASALLFSTTAGSPAELARAVPRSMPLPGTPYGLAYDPARDRLWVTLTATNQLVGLDTRSEPPREIARIPTVRQPDTVAVDEATGRLAVAGATDGTVQLVPGPP
jgi:DNA-binding beta-propeller fold protein YncE